VTSALKARASLGDWVAGARPRTLPAAVVPVAVGSGVADVFAGFHPWRAIGALIVALALQIGVNYANDYSDGIRGTDNVRSGPMRLVASGLASPRRVLSLAIVALSIAAVAGVITVAVTGTWGLLVVGFAAIIAAWTYTGGKYPYGYRALGEVGVFLFFGIAAVVGTAYVQLERLSRLSFVLALPIGLLACALLVVNNLRDIPTDAQSGKTTLAVLLGDKATRQLYIALIIAAFVIIIGVVPWLPILATTLLAAPFAISPIGNVHSGATGAKLIPVLVATGRFQLVFGGLLTLALFLS
jgi:1,4-dihydroxy-2-naphthoate polyprenyltransferase